ASLRPRFSASAWAISMLLLSSSSLAWSLLSCWLSRASSWDVFGDARAGAGAPAAVIRAASRKESARVAVSFFIAATSPSLQVRRHSTAVERGPVDGSSGVGGDDGPEEWR